MYLKGDFKLYDGLILPHEEATGTLKKFFDAATQLIGLSKSTKIPKYSEAQQLALFEHLSTFKNHLIKCDLVDTPKMNMKKCVDNAYHIFFQLHDQKIYHGDPSGKDPSGKGPPIPGIWQATNLNQVYLFLLIC